MPLKLVHVPYTTALILFEQKQEDRNSCPAVLLIPQAKTAVACQHWFHTLTATLQVVGDVLNLHGIASRLRAQRFERGCLKLDNVKLSFQMDNDGNPLAASPHGEPTQSGD